MDDDSLEGEAGADGFDYRSAWGRIRRSDRLGLVVGILLSLGWLVQIVVDGAWWQLLVWIFVVPFAIGGMIVYLPQLHQDDRA